ncbi:hypothetical protein OQA88_9553 [Cercophora sp. LCS_1]
MGSNITTSANETLKGHRLVILMPMEIPTVFLEPIQAKYPDLKIEAHRTEWGSKASPIPEEDWKDVTILLTFLPFPTPEQAPNLQYVQLISAGANHILDVPLFKDTSIPFCTANGVHGPQISEWIISTYLAFTHALPRFLDQQKEAHWDRGNLLTFEDAVSKTIGILGYGSIGRQTARVASAMGMKVHAYTLHPRPTPASRHDNGWTPPGLGDPEGIYPAKWFSGSSTEDLHAFLSSGLDLLVIATPLTKNTKHLLSKAEFEVLASVGKGKTFVSNIARGPVIHTDDLIEASEGGLIKGAALDVTDPEPLEDGHRLWGTKNVIITPHVSGASAAYAGRVLQILGVNLERFVLGEKLVNQVERGRGY